jgi:hypothetical protein
MLYQITSNIICISLVCLHQQLFYSFDNSQLPGSSSVKRGIYSQFLSDLLALGKKRHCLPEQVFVSARTNSHTCIYISYRNIGKHPYIMNTDPIRSDPILPFDNLEHILHETSRGIIISSGIIRTLAHAHSLDLLVIGMNRETLAASNDSDGGGTGVGHLHAEGFGEGCGWVSDECYHGSFDSEVFSPSLHCYVR